MADLSVYLVLGLVIVPPVLRQAKALLQTAQTHAQRHPSQPLPPSFLSRARLTPFASPFASTVTIASIALVLISIRNLIPVEYGVDVQIPASTIDTVRKAVYTLYTAPSSYNKTEHIENAPLHLNMLRGGYRPDLFLAYDAPITIPTTTLRNLIDMAGSLLPIGYHANQLELQALIARLSSYEGRRMYLLLGPRPLVDCTFCKTGIDYFWYALPFLLQTFAWRILAVGLLTAHPDDSIAVAVRQLGTAMGAKRGSDGNARVYEADRSGWRSTAVACLCVQMLMEALIMWEFGQVTAGSSRLNHWHCNLHILRQLVFLSLVLVIYFWPLPRTLSTFEQSIHHLDSTQSSIQSLLHIAEMIDLSRTLVLQDDHLLEISRQWRSEHPEATPTLDPRNVLKIAQSQSDAAVLADVERMSNGVRQAADVLLQHAHAINDQADRQAHLAAAARTPSPAPPTSTPIPNLST